MRGRDWQSERLRYIVDFDDGGTGHGTSIVSSRRAMKCATAIGATTLSVWSNRRRRMCLGMHGRGSSSGWNPPRVAKTWRSNQRGLACRSMRLRAVGISPRRRSQSARVKPCSLALRSRPATPSTRSNSSRGSRPTNSGALASHAAALIAR
jgi:hypothetical protein